MLTPFHKNKKEEPLFDNGLINNQRTRSRIFHCGLLHEDGGLTASPTALGVISSSELKSCAARYEGLASSPAGAAYSS
jgi:hypothetical protein